MKLEDTEKHNPELLYFMHKNFRKQGAWSYFTKDGVCVRKVTQDEFNALTQKENLEEELLDSLLGFTKVFRLLTSLKKPIVGHNVLTDLSLLAHTFEFPLPHSYKKFKTFLHDLFPTVYDTKTLSYQLRNDLEQSKKWKQNLLNTLYEYFKDGDGRHLALNSPYIQLKNNASSGQFHNAGFDSYCTGYIFIRMAHIFASKDSGNPKQIFMSGQLFNAISRCKNCLNVIRGALAYVVSINKYNQLIILIFPITVHFIY